MKHVNKPGFIMTTSTLNTILTRDFKEGMKHVNKPGFIMTTSTLNTILTRDVVNDENKQTAMELLAGVCASGGLSAADLHGALLSMCTPGDLPLLPVTYLQELATMQIHGASGLAARAAELDATFEQCHSDLAIQRAPPAVSAMLRNGLCLKLMLADVFLKSRTAAQIVA
jgi:hypothetical protein